MIAALFACLGLCFTSCTQGTGESEVLSPQEEPETENTSVESVLVNETTLTGTEKLGSGNLIITTFNFNPNTNQEMDMPWTVARLANMMVIKMDTTTINALILDVETGTTDRGAWGESPYTKYILEPSAFTDTENAYLHKDKMFLSLELTSAEDAHSSTQFTNRLK